MFKKSKSRLKEDEEVLTLKDVLDLGGTQEDYESLKDIRDGTGTAKHGKQSKKSLEEDELKEFIKSVGFDLVKKEELEVADEDIDDSDHVSIERNSKIFDKKKVRDKKEKAVTKKEKFDFEKKGGKGNVLKVINDEKNVRDKPDPKKVKSGSGKKEDKGNIVKKSDRPPLQVSLVSTTVDDTLQSPVKQELAARCLPPVYHYVVDLAKIMPKKLVMKPSGIWYADDTYSAGVEDDNSYKQTDPLIVTLTELGIKLLESEANMFKQRRELSKEGNDAWMKTVSTAGTLSDKVAAYTLMIQQAPIHNYRCLDMFLGMLKKKGKREALIALDALQHIFVAELLPDNRQLRSFHQQPIKTLKTIFERDHGGAMIKRSEIHKYLIQWTFEDYVKNIYKVVVDTIRDVFLQDSLEAMKVKGLRVTLELIKSKPEQEHELLTMLVNKLGDPKYKIASKALHMLHCLIQEHPVMQGVVVSAVRDLLLRPHIQAKCQYYCICFMSAQILSHERRDVADLLVQIYLAFFKAAVSQKDVDNKLLGAILTGVNRAYPYTNADDEKIIEELNVLYRTIHVSSFATSVQAMTLLFQVLSSRNELNDRYYNALYSTLMHPELSISTQRHPMYLNLLFRSLKADPSETRVKAFLKRVLQSSSLQRPPYINAVLVLITELIRLRPNLKRFLGDAVKKSGTGNEMLDDSDEEHFVDLDEHGVADSKQSSTEKNAASKSWTHIHLKSEATRSAVYDALHRTPAYANAEASSLWELGRIQRHFHPAVAKFADQLAESRDLSLPDRYTGDPLEDFTLMRFLDKFVYRNPKARQEKERKANLGESVFRRKRKLYMSQANEIAANTPEFLKKESYRPDEIFLQRYFASRATDLPPTKIRKKDENTDVEVLSDDEFDKFLESAEGQMELDTQYKFAEGTVQATGKRKNAVVPVHEDGSGDEFDDGDFDEPKGEISDTFDENMGFVDVGEDEEARPAKSTKVRKNEPSDADFEAFDMMLEENAQQKLGFGGSGAVRNADNSSVRQLKWEHKRETKDIIARKRAAKRNPSNFNRHSSRGKARNGPGRGRPNSFRGKARNGPGRGRPNSFRGKARNGSGRGRSRRGRY